MNQSFLSGLEGMAGTTRLELAPPGRVARTINLDTTLVALPTVLEGGLLILLFLARLASPEPFTPPPHPDLPLLSFALLSAGISNHLTIFVRMISKKYIDTPTTSCYSFPCLSNPILARLPCLPRAPALLCETSPFSASLRQILTRFR